MVGVIGDRTRAGSIKTRETGSPGVPEVTPTLLLDLKYSFAYIGEVQKPDQLIFVML
jgi:hypothetical protein